VLTVRSIHSSCGCLETKVTPKDTFAPGEKGQIEFVFDSSFFLGEIVRTITIDTNTKPPSTQTLSFSASVAPELSFRPNLIALGEIPKETAKSLSVQVVGLGRAPLAPKSDVLWEALLKSPVMTRTLQPADREKILSNQGELDVISAVSSSPFLEVEISERSLEKQVWVVKVKLVPPLPIGSFREKVTILNNSTHLKLAEIPVSAEVVGHVKVSSKYIEFGVVSEDTPVRRSLTLKSDQSNFSVKGVDLELKKSDALKMVKASDLITTTLQRNKDGVTILFDLKRPKKFPTDLQNINASGVFLVRTSDPDYNEIRVPFFGVLRNDSR
jgi:hypothetical protein